MMDVLEDERGLLQDKTEAAQLGRDSHEYSRASTAASLLLANEV